MSKISYAQARADHEYLWDIAPAKDMTGAYVDQNDLARLLRSPTKATARDCYCDQIDYWFHVGPDCLATTGTVDGDADRHINADPMVREIAIRHGVIEGTDDDE